MMNRPNKQDYPVGPSDEPIVEFKKYTDALEKYADELELKFNRIDKEQKYRWHSLEENPDDRPAEDGTYEVCVEWVINEKERISNYHIGKWSNISQFYKILAWREIEPYKKGDSNA